MYNSLRKCFSLFFSIGNGVSTLSITAAITKGWQRISQNSGFYLKTTSDMFASKLPEPPAARGMTVP